MKNFKRRTMWRWLVLGGVTVANFASGQTLPAMTVRVDSLGPASPREAFEMKDAAGAVFRHAGIPVRWVDCWSFDSSCGAPNLSKEPAIRLRIVRHLDRGEIHTLGWTALGSSAATIRYERAQQFALASATGISPGLVLGYVAAHEIGHLLLGSSRHDSFGVMKAAYGAQDLLRMAEGWLFFTQEEERLLRARAGLERRGPSDPAPGPTLQASNAVKH